ncbi:hypothetical protein Pyn_36748 [Prunus yedoensis var. nudiflora]|uniref:Uncharacterized protein n=1 Tax=Prunus yedoensis var. nudiflora TaxID=2094558 RepID=A0A314Z6T4_PRUYE|nr:hypothetical protein Pyn_36748 [Prunus yedoensis var. nudiflora]
MATDMTTLSALHKHITHANNATTLNLSGTLIAFLAAAASPDPPLSVSHQHSSLYALRRTRHHTWLSPLKPLCFPSSSSVSQSETCRRSNLGLHFAWTLPLGLNPN